MTTKTKAKKTATSKKPSKAKATTKTKAQAATESTTTGDMLVGEGVPQLPRSRDVDVLNSDSLTSAMDKASRDRGMSMRDYAARLSEIAEAVQERANMAAEEAENE